MAARQLSGTPVSGLSIGSLWSILFLSGFSRYGSIPERTAPFKGIPKDAILPQTFPKRLFAVAGDAQPDFI